MDFTYEPGSWHMKSAEHCQDQIPLVSMVGKGLPGDSYKVTMEENDDGTWVLKGWKRTGNSDVWILDWMTSPMYQGDIWSTWYIAYRIAKALGVDPEFIKRLLDERDYKPDVNFGENEDGTPRDTKEYIDDRDDETLADAKDYADDLDAALRTWANLTFALIGHVHDDRYYTKALADGRFSQIGHTHDDRYYTESEVNALLANKSNTGHTHDDRYYTESEADGRFAAKSHNHDDRYYTEAEVSSILNNYLLKASFGDFFNAFYQEPEHAASSYNMGGSGVKSFLQGLGFTYINQSEIPDIQARVEWHKYAPLFVVKFNGIVPTNTAFRDRSGGMTQNTSTATEITMYKLPDWATPDFQWEVPCIGANMFIHICGKDSGSDAGQVRLMSTNGAIAGKAVSGALSFYCQTPPVN